MMMHVARLKRLAGLVALLSLASCGLRIQQMRIHLDNEKHGSFVFTASTELKAEEDGDENSAAQRYMQRFEQKLRSCGLGTSLFTKGGKFWVNARMVFNYPHEATSALGCAPTTWNDMDLQINKAEGIFWDTYTTKLLFSQPMLATPEDKDKDGDIDPDTNPLGSFPRVLRVTVPGTIDSIANDSRILGGRVVGEESGPSNLQATFSHDFHPASTDSKARKRFLAEKTAAFKAGKLRVEDFEKQGSDVLALSVVSHERNYDLKDLLSVLGVLFGSGFLLQLLGRWVARRAKPAGGPPA